MPDVDTAACTALKETSGAVRRKKLADEPEDATAETRRMFGHSVLADGPDSGGNRKASGGPLPPPSERGVAAMFASPTQAMSEMRVIKDQFASLKQLASKSKGWNPNSFALSGTQCEQRATISTPR